MFQGGVTKMMGVWSVVFKVHLGVRLDCHLLHAHVIKSTLHYDEACHSSL